MSTEKSNGVFILKHSKHNKYNIFTVPTHQHIWHIILYTVIDQWSGFRPGTLTRPKKAPAKSIHSFTEKHCDGHPSKY